MDARRSVLLARVAVVVALGLAGLTGCGDDDAVATDATPFDGASADAEWRNGCPSLRDPEAAPGDPIEGDTFASFAAGFFATWCTRCHSETLTTPEERNNAPAGFNWDVEVIVRDHLGEIRNAVGVGNYMPFLPPDPTCDERRRLIRWIDAAAP